MKLAQLRRKFYSFCTFYRSSNTIMRTSRMFPYSLQQCVNQSAYLFSDNILLEAFVDIHI